MESYGVLLSRGSDVISDLENTDTNAAQIDSKEKCELAAEALVPGATEQLTFANLGSSEGPVRNFVYRAWSDGPQPWALPAYADVSLSAGSALLSSAH